MKLEGKNIKITSTEKSDKEFDSLFENEVDLYNMSETRLYPKGLPLEMVFKIESGNEVVGQIKLTRIRWFNRKAEISIAVKKNNQKKGIGTEALKIILDFAFNKMNLHRLEAEVIEFNEASIKLVEKFGFKREGQLREAKYSDGKYWDIIRYGLLKNESKQ